MKKLIIVILIFAFHSCSKQCYTCTRTWKYRAYQRMGPAADAPCCWQSWQNGKNEVFEVCGSDEMKQAEKTQNKDELTTGTHWVESIGTCNCEIK